MKNKFLYILSGITLILGYSCTENIDIDYSTKEERLVVDAKLTNERKAHSVLLMRINLNPEDSIVSGLTGAKVTLSDGTNTIALTESDERVGLYVTPDTLAGIPGKTYTLQITGVEVNGTGTDVVYTASATMPKPLAIDYIKAQYNDKWEAWELQCWATDPPTTDYYLFKAWRNGVCVTDSIFEWQFTDDAMFNGNPTNGIPCQYLYDEFKDEYIVDGDSVELEIDKIDKDYYRYLTELQSEYYGSNPMFGGPPSNVYSNFDNRAIGCFAVYSVNKAGYRINNAARN